MSELGSIDFGDAQGGVSSSAEGLSEEAVARLQANAAAIAAIRKQEKQTKKGDDAVVSLLLQFLNDAHYSHLFTLIARLIARNCPSIFILSIIALVHTLAAEEVERVLDRHFATETRKGITETALSQMQDLIVNERIVEWLTSVQMILSLNPDGIIRSLLLDEKNIDGSVLQLTAFIMADYFALQQKAVTYEQVQPVAMQLLQSILAPYISAIQKSILEQKTKSNDEDED
jgi:hypothetical protein